MATGILEHNVQFYIVIHNTSACHHLGTTKGEHPLGWRGHLGLSQQTVQTYCTHARWQTPGDQGKCPTIELTAQALRASGYANTDWSICDARVYDNIVAGRSASQIQTPLPG